MKTKFHGEVDLPSIGEKGEFISEIRVIRKRIIYIFDMKTIQPLIYGLEIAIE
jgi:hypothetical protein